MYVSRITTMIFKRTFKECSRVTEFFSVKFGPKLLPRATKLGQGYIFTGVCHSVNRGGCLVSAGCLVLGGACWRTPTPRRLLLWTVCILLECILVLLTNRRISLQMGPPPIQPDKWTEMKNSFINNFRLKNFVMCEHTINCFGPDHTSVVLSFA